MDLQWNKNACSYLHRNIREVQNQEQIQEVRLPDGMPDIGRIICSWGQAVIRSKEWRSDGMTVSGGVNAWVLYAPEDGSEPRNMEVWLPFQTKWNFPESKREGTIRTSCLLRSVDARTLSARKMMVRATVGILGEALEPEEAMIYAPEDVPDGVQLLTQTYPAVIPKEAGEKIFLIDEEVNLQGEMPRRLLAWDLQPEITEQGVLGGKAVFRGNGRLHLVYWGEDEKIHSTCQEIPFAQYVDLDREYDKEATMSVMMALSSLEPELEEGHIHVKSGMVAQYVIYDRSILEVAEDAYSPLQEVVPNVEELNLPMLLDRRSETMEIQQEIEEAMPGVIDCVFYPDQPTQYREGDSVILELPGTVQVLYTDGDGKLQSKMEKCAAQLEMNAGEGCSLLVNLESCGSMGQAMSGNGVRVQGEVKVEVLTAAQQGIPMVAGLTVGEEMKLDPERPSLIIRRLEDKTLWELAKSCGSTVDAIRKANQLSDEPVAGQMLLIPVC